METETKKRTHVEVELERHAEKLKGAEFLDTVAHRFEKYPGASLCAHRLGKSDQMASCSLWSSFSQKLEANWYTALEEVRKFFNEIIMCERYQGGVNVHTGPEAFHTKKGVKPVGTYAIELKWDGEYRTVEFYIKVGDAYVEVSVPFKDVAFQKEPMGRTKDRRFPTWMRNSSEQPYDIVAYYGGVKVLFFYTVDDFLNWIPKRNDY